MTNSGNWFTRERLDAVNAAAHRVRCNTTIAGREGWAGQGEPTQQGQRTLSSFTPRATDG